MVKQKKEETAELMISIEQFTRTRDSVSDCLYFCCNALLFIVIPCALRSSVSTSAQCHS